MVPYLGGRSCPLSDPDHKLGSSRKGATRTVLLACRSFSWSERYDIFGIDILYTTSFMPTAVSAEAERCHKWK